LTNTIFTHIDTDGGVTFANHIQKNFQYDSYHIHLTNTIFTHIDTDGGVTFATL